MEDMSYRKGTDGMMYPNLKPSDQTQYPIGKYGDLRLTFIKEHRKGTYTTLVTEFRLNEHLHEIEVKAKEMLSRLISEMAKSRGVDEKMKAETPMKWVQEMNSIKNSAEETVLTDLIYA